MSGNEEEGRSVRSVHIDPAYAMAMREKGFSWNTLASIRKVSCPQCGFMFSLTYSRTVACKGCPMATQNCPKARCAKCDHEFYLNEMPHVGNNKYTARSVAVHQSNIESQYNEQLGRKRHR
ncbi:hypothetical protein [Methanomassiliicoccus luminyensis]|jgi:hypothetical protein|uniref:hypothetical protein n=1 Tax=Methanomassiliicoccus luminyensis TaxID=1080712 RepID=UPI000371FCD5|nr:hypothetical protein [Methanomassiliicoccus luminyensis]